MKNANRILISCVIAFGSIAFAEEAVKQPKNAAGPATSAPANAAPADNAAPKADAPVAAADKSDVSTKKVRYRAGKTIDLDQKSIDGKMRRPDISVITGAEEKADDGILRLRTDFLDRIAVAAGEEIQ